MLERLVPSSSGKPANFPVVNTTSRRPDHEVLLADMRVLSTDWDDEPAVLALLRDVTERSVADAEMAYRATHDPVTALPNRYLLDDRLRQALARDRRAPTTLAVLFCDVDGLKGINDRLGHGVGDQVLVETARRIEAVIRPADTAATWAGTSSSSCARASTRMAPPPSSTASPWPSTRPCTWKATS